jgi:hypothetical protein
MKLSPLLLDYLPSHLGRSSNGEPGGLGVGIKFGQWERRVLGGARLVAWACRSQLGGAAFGLGIFFGSVYFVIWYFCYKQFLCNLYTLVEVPFFYWATENMSFLQ